MAALVPEGQGVCSVGGGQQIGGQGNALTRSHGRLNILRFVRYGYSVIAAECSLMGAA
jgi:hypothetical protein